MPCSKYSGGQRRLCFATKGWTDWSKIRNTQFNRMFKLERKEHPTLSNKAVIQIVKDHMKKK